MRKEKKIFRGEEKGEGKEGKYLERKRVWSTEEEKNATRKGRKYLVSGGEKNGEGKGGTYLEKENIWSAEQKKNGGGNEGK